ncbi:hypothetical protein [Alteromonas flava]|uniref:hypothetical protein n=1 Tax=Alteromonas flava TaxID=2048003 RepID=UPI000C286214|nr:hypothetical protein [Alteromonas flava]
MHNFEDTFTALKNILLSHANALDIVTDSNEHFYLNTHHIMPNKKPLYFGSVKVNKRAVSFHLMPVYVFPELLEKISPELKKRMQGKSCFNFNEVDPTLFNELKGLTLRGFKRYQQAGYI